MTAPSPIDRELHIISIQFNTTIKKRTTQITTKMTKTLNIVINMTKTDKITAKPAKKVVLVYRESFFVKVNSADSIGTLPRWS